jgi:hypothetical protein
MKSRGPDCAKRNGGPTPTLEELTMPRWLIGSSCAALIAACGTMSAAGSDDAARPSTASAPADFPAPADPPMPLRLAKDAGAPAQQAAHTSTDDVSPYGAIQAKPMGQTTVNFVSLKDYYEATAASPAAAAGVQIPIDGACQDDYPTGRLYGSVEFLLFEMRKGSNPPLVQVVSPEAANIAINTGELPPNAAINIFDQFGTDPNPFTGIKAFAGYWFNPAGAWGAELGYIQLFRESSEFSIISGGIPVIGRNFVDVSAGRESFLRYTHPDGTQRGYIRINAPTQAAGGELNLRYRGATVLADRTEWISGFRYFNLRDALGIDSGASFFTPTGEFLQSFDSAELFKAKNEFYGGQIGVENQYRLGCWTLDIGGKIAFGVVRQELDIQGVVVQTVAGQAPVGFPNNSLLFVQPTNAGSYSRDDFSVLPEFFFRVGYQLTPRVRATIGYDIIALSNVARAATGIDVGVNPNVTQFIVRNQESSAIRPAFDFDGSDWWAQGLTLGIAVNY